MVFLLVVVSTIVVVAAGLTGGRAAGPAVPRWLRWTALAAAAGGAVVLAPTVFPDAGWFTAVLLGVPVVLAAVPVVWDLAGAPGATAVNWAAAALAICWALLLALGIGLALLPAAWLQLAAAATTAANRRRAGVADRA